MKQRERKPGWLLTTISLAVIVPVGFYSKFYEGPASNWVNNSLGGVFYVIFWCLIVYLVLPRSRPAIVVAAVLLATCGLEFMQLWHPAFLQAIRKHFLGRTLLGTTYAQTDFVYYFIGAFLGWLWLLGIRWRREKP